jgi:hypothetical protein
MSSMTASNEPVIEAPQVQAPVVEPLVATPADNSMSYSTMSSGNTRAQPDTIAEATASKDQLLAMYAQAVEQLSKYKGAQIPTLASYERADIQAALNTAQANLDAEEGKKMQEAMMGGALKVAGVGSVLGVLAGEKSSEQVTSSANINEAGKEVPLLASSNSLFASILAGKGSFNLGSKVEDLSKETPEQFQVAANLPEVSHAVSSKKNVDLAGQGELQRQLRGSARALPAQG